MENSVKRIYGFSMVELLMTLLLIAILAAIAYPSYRSFMQNTRATAVTNEFMSALAYARSEALKRGLPVTVCPASDTNLTDCGNSGSWSNGWIVFVDPDADGAIGNSADRLKTHDQLQGGSVVTSTQARVTYNRSGFLTAGVGSFTVTAAGCSGNSARLITLSATGRANVTTTACTIP
jgi:type IV fimbrial biogenesis protein FimT